MRLIAALFISLVLSTNSFANAPLTIQTIDESIVNFSDLKGKWVVINFWASWCEPCIAEISELNKLYKQRSKDIAVFAVNFDGLDAGLQKEAANKYAINYPSILYSSLQGLNLGEISVVPITFIFNPNGKLATKLFGGQTVASIEKAINDQEQQ